MMQADLFPESARPSTSRWRPPEVLPSLAGVQRVAVDTEGSDKDKRLGKSCGLSVCGRRKDGTKVRAYLPWGHEGGGNLDKATVLRWAKFELAGKDIVNLHVAHDFEQLRDQGVDFEAMGCKLHEVAFPAALLNENRYKGLNLNDLGLEYVGRGKRELDVPKHLISQASAWEVGPYAEEDAELALDVDEATAPLIVRDDLTRVLALEDDLLYCTSHMERNGARLDMPKLERWRREAAEEFGQAVLDIWKATGVRVNPNADADKLFAVLGLTTDARTPKGDPSYTAEVLRAAKHPLVDQFLRAKRLSSIDSKYLKKYQAVVKKYGKLIFSLHQLRAGEDDYGTITGRFSSSNVNIQQVMKVEKQIEEFGDEFIIRELFIPDDGFDFFAADASQIEFRLFAHYSGDEALVQAYCDDPDIDFHLLVTKMMLPGVTDPKELKAGRKTQKHNNFGKLYGMGRPKLARRLGLACTCGCPDKGFWDNRNHAEGCPARLANYIADEYDHKFPAAKRLMNAAMRIAEERGYVKTLLGRRGRFPDKTGFHKALNKVIQGSAADLNKLKLLRLYNERGTVGIHKLRLTVHDEAVGDLERGEGPLKRLKECLAVQEIQLKVPLTWDTKVGRSWRDCA